VKSMAENIRPKMERNSGKPDLSHSALRQRQSYPEETRGTRARQLPSELLSPSTCRSWLEKMLNESMYACFTPIPNLHLDGDNHRHNFDTITSDRVCVPYFLAVTLWKSCLLNACRSTSFRNPAEWHRAYQPAADAKSGTKTFLRKTSAAPEIVSRIVTESETTFSRSGGESRKVGKWESGKVGKWESREIY